MRARLYHRTQEARRLDDKHQGRTVQRAEGGLLFLHPSASLVASTDEALFQFRLRASGIGQVIYLVEEYNADYHYAAWPEQIATALSSTQVIEGFFLKRTMSLDDTLAYLGGLHETIVKLHEVCPNLLLCQRHTKIRY